MSFSADLASLYGQAATNANKTARGAKPADLPIEQSREFHLAADLGTTKALGGTMLHVILLRADEVIR